MTGKSVLKLLQETFEWRTLFQNSRLTKPNMNYFQFLALSVQIIYDI